jgi:hypothetical protein
MRIIYVTALLLVLLAAGQGGAMGKKSEIVALTGTIRVVGNAPFTRVVLTPETVGQDIRERDYLLLGALEDELRTHYQGQRVTLEGAPCVSPTPQFPRCFEPRRIVGGSGR